MSLDRAIRTQGNPSFGVTLHYNADKTKVSARSHFPYMWVNTNQLHIDKSTYCDASPIDREFEEYFGAMTVTIGKIDEAIADLTAKRDALQLHLDDSMMQFAPSTKGVQHE